MRVIQYENNAQYLSGQLFFIEYAKSMFENKCPFTPPNEEHTAWLTIGGKELVAVINLTLLLEFHDEIINHLNRLTESNLLSYHGERTRAHGPCLLTAVGKVFLDNCRASSSLSISCVCECCELMRTALGILIEELLLDRKMIFQYLQELKSIIVVEHFLSASAASSCVRHLMFSSSNFCLIA